ncbi:hypothetical protein ACKWTF_008098 [Chironomus riparius]
MRQSVQVNLIFLLVGAVLIVVGGCILIFWPAIFKSFLSKELMIDEKSQSFKEWKSPSIELYFDVYLFNWTNAEDFTFPEFTKPIFEELGPYRFREYRDKTDLKFHQHNSTVSYKPFSTYIFDDQGSKGSLDDVLTTINVVAVGAVAQSLKMDYNHKKLISIALNGYEEEITVTKSARELLFEGYEDNMVLMGKANLIEGFNISHIPYDKIGFFYMRNASTALSGMHNVHTGKDDSSKLGTIQNYKGSDFSNMYGGECSKVKGSPGELFPLDQQPASISIFTPDMCRSLPFDFEREVDVFGVKGYRYLAGERLIDNGTKYPVNLCYSEGSERTYPSGVFNLSACRFSSPVFMSYPHFYGADEYYLDLVEGLEPNRSKHESYITLEPMTGVPLEVVMRFQLNFLLKDSEDIALFQSCPTTFIPTLWVEQKYKIDEKMIDELKIAVKVPYFGRIVGLIIFVLGIVCVLITIIIKCITRQTLKEADVNLPEIKGENRKPKERSSPLLTDGKLRQNIKIQKMDQQVD